MYQALTSSENEAPGKWGLKSQSDAPDGASSGVMIGVCRLSEVLDFALKIIKKVKNIPPYDHI